MPLKIEAVFLNTARFYVNQPGVYVNDAWLVVSGVTPGNTLASYNYSSAASPPATTTAGGFAVGSSTSRCLLPIDYSDEYQSPVLPTAATFSITVKDLATSEVVTASKITSVATSPSTWSITQDQSSNVLVTCTSFGPDASVYIGRDITSSNSSVISLPPYVFNVALVEPSGGVVTSVDLRGSVMGEYPAAFFPSSVVSKTQKYQVLIRHRSFDYYAGANNSGTNYLLNNVLTYVSTLTAPSISSSGSAGLFTWLSNDQWWLTDLQVNLATRSVTHRHGTVQIKPNDTVQFAVLFHNGTSGVDPVATDVRLAVRSSSNASAYYIWANPSVTTTSSGGDVYYTITVTASDEDLLAAQAAGLVAGTNTSQALLAEVQWTTTRGTFTSDTFNITVDNEIIREPDV